jgi:membrane glycosyltransferase
MHDSTPLSTGALLSAGLPVNNFPVQDLERFNEATRRVTKPDTQAFWRRLIVFGGAALITAYLTYKLYNVLFISGILSLEVIVFYSLLLLFFSLNTAWLSLSFMTAVSGFLTIAFRAKKSIIGINDIDMSKPMESKTAILICTYNEPPERIFGLALATIQSLTAGRHARNFDVFIISDTTDPDIWVQEEAAYQAVLNRGHFAPRLFYRRRSTNAGKKAGNIADWCRRWGHAYDQMLVFDADSLMSAEAVERLAAGMEANPDVGLIQSVPLIINRHTLFARLQQFAGRVYGPVHATGIAFWHRGNGNFWGHNAIIRTRAFMESAGLPDLPGKPPFGGMILSHDFVEGALLVRAGWRVCMVPELKGSYEESPPSLLDFAIRDRRWCQGNMQHSRILGAKGLHWLSRLHMVMGIMGYVSVLLWLLFLVTALYVTIHAMDTPAQYFSPNALSYALFPTWPVQDFEGELELLFWTLGLLLLPKVFGYLVALAGPERKAFGGAIPLTFGLLVETLFSSLIAHVFMALQSAAIIQVLLGRDSGWKPQHRDDGSMPSLVIMRYHLLHMLIGISLGVLAYRTSMTLFLWMLPATLGLSLSGPISALTAKRSWGRAFAYLRLLQIPEEVSPPPIALQVHACQQALAPEILQQEAITRLACNAPLRRLHKELIQIQPVSLETRFSPNLAIGRAKLEVSGSLPELLALLKPGEKAALLSDPESLARLEMLLPQEMQARPAGT